MNDFPALVPAILLKNFLGRYGLDLEDRDWKNLSAGMGMLARRCPPGWVSERPDRRKTDLPDSRRQDDAAILVATFAGYKNHADLSEKTEHNVEIMIKAARRYT